MRPATTAPAGTSPAGVAASPAERRLAEVGILVVMALWAGNFIVVKTAVEVVPPVGFTFLRFGLASLTLLGLLRWREGSIGLPRRDLLAIGGLGVVGFGLYQILWTTGLTTVAAGDSALLIAATPVFVSILAVAAGSDVLTPAKLGGGLISFAGVAIVIGSGAGLTLGGSIVGEAITLLAALCWSVYTAFGAPYLRRYSPLRTTTWATVAGTLALAPIATGQLAAVPVSAFGPDVVGAVLYSAFLSAGLSNVIVLHGVRLVGPTRASAYQFLVPALAVVLAAVVLAEAVRPGQVLGGLVIVAGVLITRGSLPVRLVRVTRAASPSRPRGPE